MPTRIDVLIPTRKRPGRLKELLESLWMTADHPEAVKPYFYIDEDDHETVAFLEDRLEPNHLAWKVGPRVILSRAWDALWHISSGPIIMHGGDDIIFTTKGWDEMARKAFSEESDAYWLVYGPDGIQNQALGTHSFVTRRATELLGYFVPPYFPALYNDTWLNEVYQRINRRKYVPSLAIEHKHFSKYPELWDETYAQKRAQNKAKAHVLWQVTEDERIGWAERLAQAITEEGQKCE